MNRGVKLFCKFFLLASIGILVFKNVYANECTKSIKAISTKQLGVLEPIVTLPEIKKKLGEPTRINTLTQEIVLWDKYAVLIRDDVVMQEIGGERPSALPQNKPITQIKFADLKQALGEPSLTKKNILKDYYWSCDKDRSILQATFESTGTLFELESNFCFQLKNGGMFFCMGGLSWVNRKEAWPFKEELLYNNVSTTSVE
jgi:hypothetical protein